MASGTDLDRKAVIVGGGPAGALSAIYLAKSGFNVQVFDRRSIPEWELRDDDARAYELNLGPRGQTAAEGAGVNLEPLRSTFDFCMIRYGKTGKVDFKHTTAANESLFVGRDTLNLHLINEAKRLHPEAIQFHFEHPLGILDIPNQTATFQPIGADASIQFKYDLLVGADGASSLVRDSLAAHLPEASFCKEKHDSVYRTFVFPASCQADLDNFPPGSQNFYAYDIQDKVGGVEVATNLFVKTAKGASKARGSVTISSPSIGTYGSPEAILPCLRVLPFSDAFKLVVAQQLATTKDWYPISPWVVCSQLHGPRVVLLGDAAHSVTPVLGQGCNSALEDCAVLARVLQESEGDLDAVPARYTAARLPDAHALVWLNKIVASERNIAHSRNILGVKSLFALLGWHFILHGSLHACLPKLCQEPAFLRVIGGKAPYGEAKSSMLKDGLLLSAGVAALLAFVVGRSMR